MELGVFLVGILLRFLNFLVSPICWLKSRSRRAVPPIRNTLLLHSATELVHMIRKGERTSEEIVSVYIERIKEVDPYIHAVVDERFEAALEEARLADAEIERARAKGTTEKLFKDKPLLGLPFTVKESCSLAGLSNSVGCLEHARSRAAADGAAVARLRRAGAVALLVSSTPELCLGWETASLLRANTCNPYRLSRAAGGSSGGEAALVGSGASVAGVASDIAGSIRLPAAFCGVFGLKPSPGIIPIAGHIPTLADARFPRLLAVGPLVRRAEDLSLLLPVMAGDNSGILRLGEKVRPESLKIYYMCRASESIALIPVQRCIVDAIHDSVRYLQSLGCTVLEDKFEELEDSVEMSVSVFFSMKGIPNMLQDPDNPKRERSLITEIVKSFLGIASRSLQGLCFAAIHRSRLFIPESKVPHYIAKAQRLKDKITKVLGEDGVLIYPVFHEQAIPHNQVYVRAAGVLYTMAANVLGLPALAAPVAARAGLPVALQVIAGPNQDRLCVAVAELLEKGFGGWRPPT